MAVETFSYNGTRVANEVKAKFGDIDAVQITDDLILVWINNGIRTIASENRFIEKVSTTNLIAGQSSYDIAALLTGQKMQSLVQLVANGQLVEVVQWPAFTDSFLSRAESAEYPTVGAIFGSTLTLWPSPSKTVANGITFYYTAFPADLTSLSTALTIPDRFYNALVDYVHAQALELDDNFEAAGVKMQQHQQSVRREFEKEHQSPSDYYPSISPDPDDDVIFGVA